MMGIEFGCNTFFKNIRCEMLNFSTPYASEAKFLIIGKITPLKNTGEFAIIFLNP